jgi:hypothetical protein
VRRHETDFVSLVAGGLFLVVAAVHFATQGTEALTLQWTVAGLLVLLGVLGLLGVLRGFQSGGEDESSTADTAALPREDTEQTRP